MIVKVCGMTQGENIRAVEALGADWLGFIFYGPSPRCLRQMPTYLPTRARRVGVFGQESQETIHRLARLYALDYSQLEGELDGFDYVLFGLGARNYDPLSEELKAFVPEVFVIGDAIKARQSSDAMHEGFEVAYNL